MAVPTAKTWADSDALSTSNLNSGVRDPAAFGMKPPSCVVTRSTAQTGIVSATITDIVFDTEVFDNYGMFSPSSATITIAETGLYVVSAYLAIESNATGYRRLLINHNGSFPAIDGRQAVTGDATHMTIGVPLLCNSGDTLKLAVEQTSGANRSTAGTPRFGVTWQSAS